MAGGICGDILALEGFTQIGELSHRLRCSAWWHAGAKIEMLALALGSKTLLKGHKSYVMHSITEEGQTYSRDIAQLHDYLESHSPEVRIAFSFFRDVPPTIASEHVRRKTCSETPTVEIPTSEELSRLQRELERRRQDANSLAALSGLHSNGVEETSALLRGYVNGQIAASRRSVQSLEESFQSTRERSDRFQHLQREYARNGSAGVFTFSISSNLQLATRPEELRDSVRSIIKELTDLHRYQITQKLGGGRLAIHVEESELPELSWIEEWFGGALSPTQLERLKPEFEVLRNTTRSRVMVTPDEDIRVDGHFVEARKLLGARVISTLAQRLDRTGAGSVQEREIPASALPLRIGRLVRGETVSPDEYLLPLHGANHIYSSGTTGSGKSYLGRAIVEEAASHDTLSILVLDPRNQSAGLLVPEDREEILSLYTEFGLSPDRARGFSFTYCSPGQQIGVLPTNLGDLGVGKHIVSFKGMDDKARCDLFADVLDAVFDRHAQSESPTTNLLIVIEEAHRFTKKRVDDSAKSAATRAENALDRTVRESRKFGCCVLILSQTIRDFAYDSASIRQNTTTKVFMHNSDREVEYASDFIGDVGGGKQVMRLQPGTAIVHHPSWGTATVRIRPPFSKVWEFSPDETRNLVEDPGASQLTVSGEARSLLATIQDLHARSGTGVNVTELCAHVGITSKRRVQSLLSQLERAHLVRSRRAAHTRGSPRLVEPIASGTSSTGRTERTQNGPKADGSAQNHTPQEVPS